MPSEQAANRAPVHPERNCTTPPASDAGSAYLFFGSATGLDASAEAQLLASDAAVLDVFGTTVAVLDVDGDDHADLVIGAPLDDDLGNASGSIYVLAGGCRDMDRDGACVDVDCDDADDGIFPGAEELPADGVDSDCDGQELCFADADGDRYTAGLTPAPLDCIAAGVRTEPSAETDCDDEDPATHPGANERAGDGQDRDCDGRELCLVDGDDDGYVLDGGTVESEDLDCHDPAEGTIEDAPGDCDDADAGVHPDATERCDERDQDCDGDVDEDAVDAPTWFVDGDGDAFGDTSRPIQACARPTRAVADGGDCDDSDAAVNPGAVEVAGDGIDQDCDGLDPAAEETGCGCDAGGWVPVSIPLALMGLLAARRRASRGRSNRRRG